jgi:putative FmdB family regulatory protein
VPTYQYACRACGHSFDTVQSFSEEALTECPECGGSLRKVFSPVGIVFRGSGFYRTDSRAGAGRNAGDPSGNGHKPDSGGTSDGSTADGGTAKSESTGDKGESSGSGSGGKSGSAGKSADKPGASAAKRSSNMPAKAS